MQKLITTALLFFVLTTAFGQRQKIVSIYLMAQYNNTINDVTRGNNPWGIGLGLQTFLNIKTKFKPTAELTGDIYLFDDKVFRTDSSGKHLIDVRGMVNFFVGASYNPIKYMYVSVIAGPSFISGQTFFGIKPSLGFYFPGSQRWTAKISYINIFNRNKTTKQDFNSLSIAIGRKIF